MIENDSKPWWQSKTIVSAMGLFLVMMFSLFGLDLAEGDAQALASGLVGIVTSALVVVNIIGRVTATKKID